MSTLRLRSWGGVPDTEQIKAIIAMLHGEGWQVLAIKGLLAGAYLWVRDRNKRAGVEFEIERLRTANTSYSYAYDSDLTKDQPMVGKP